MVLSEAEARKIAHSIAFGHAYWKHVANANEAGELITESTFESLILETLLGPACKPLRLDRTAFWNAVEGLLVVHNPADPDLGTAYWPQDGRREYESLL
jgi:hypothetical protein